LIIQLSVIFSVYCIYFKEIELGLGLEVRMGLVAQKYIYYIETTHVFVLSGGLT